LTTDSEIGVADSFHRRYHPVIIIGKVALALRALLRTRAGSTHILLRVPAVDWSRFNSPSRHKGRKPNSMTYSEPLVERLYSLDELVELRRNTLRYARSFPPGSERNRHRQVAVSLRTLFRGKKWLRTHVRNDS
jgi:hypothetical protein